VFPSWDSVCQSWIGSWLRFSGCALCAVGDLGFCGLATALDLGENFDLLVPYLFVAYLFVYFCSRNLCAFPIVRIFSLVGTKVRWWCNCTSIVCGAFGFRFFFVLLRVFAGVLALKH
jgi:hypothetical protein